MGKARLKNPTHSILPFFFFLFISLSTSTPLHYQPFLPLPLPLQNPQTTLAPSITKLPSPTYQITESPSATTLSLDLYHRDALSNSAPETLLSLRLARDATRAQFVTDSVNLAAKTNGTRPRKRDFSSSVVSGLAQGSGEYFTRLGVGTPPRYAYVVLDTGSDVVWIQCAPCEKCYSQSDPIFDPRKSTTYAAIGCSSPLCQRLDSPECDSRTKRCLYQVSYGDGSFTVGDFSTETLTFRNTRVKKVAIGCGHDNEGLFVGAAGLLGLGRGSRTPHQGHLAPPMPKASPKQEEDETPNPSKYSDNVRKRGTAAKQLVASFFQENIERARDRNARAKELDAKIKDPAIPDMQKQKDISELAQKEARFLRFIRTRESPQNFQTIKIIGKGAFGEVKLVQRKTDGKIYALKALIKSEMFKKDQLAHVRAERDILADSKDNPWLVKMHASFQDNAYLYMLMEFLPGGDLMTMLIKYEIFSEDITRFYMAEIVMAIEAVHKLGFLHRDIKPDNILLDRGGHIKLTDFGLSTGGRKQHENSYYQNLLNKANERGGNRNSMAFNEQINLTVSNRSQVNTWRKSRRHMAYSTVGTPDYIAPEIFLGQGYTYLCDWWSVGAIMFECLVGWPPFCAEDTHDTYRKIVNWRESLYFPDELVLGRDAEDMIRGFLCDANDRLGKEGGAHDGASQIKRHPFFRGVVWDQLRKIRAPFEPKLSSNIDVSYFPIDEIPQEDTSAIHRAQARQTAPEQDAEMSLPFIGYTYKAFNAFQSS